MYTYRCIVTKRDTRAYLPRPIEGVVMRRILQAGRIAGSSKDSQPCRLVVLRDAQWRAEIATCGRFAKHLPSAAVGIAICLPPTGSDFDAGRAAQNMMLAAWNEGITSCPISMHDQPCVTGKLGLPEGWRVCVVVALGYQDPSVPLGAGRKRPPLEEYVHEERW